MTQRLIDLPVIQAYVTTLQKHLEANGLPFEIESTNLTSTIKVGDATINIMGLNGHGEVNVEVPCGRLPKPESLTISPMGHPTARDEGPSVESRIELSLETDYLAAEHAAMCAVVQIISTFKWRQGNLSTPALATSDVRNVAREMAYLSFTQFQEVPGGMIARSVLGMQIIIADGHPCWGDMVRIQYQGNTRHANAAEMPKLLSDISYRTSPTSLCSWGISEDQIEISIAVPVCIAHDASLMGYVMAAMATAISVYENYEQKLAENAVERIQ